jgi:lipopolysaccharide/colanic/teichoic acid biosynthesis glycosyltransferase
MKQGTATNTWTSVNDPRITSVGKFLRMSRIDELPQFINLILGNMSLVGPRPEQPHLVEDLKRTVPFYDERHWLNKSGNCIYRLAGSCRMVNGLSRDSVSWRVSLNSWAF